VIIVKQSSGKSGAKTNFLLETRPAVGLEWGMTPTVLPHLAVHSYENFELKTLVIESQALAKNPLGDSARRTCPVLVPPRGQDLPVVLMLSGFTGNGPTAFNVKSFEVGGTLKLDEAVSRGEAPRAVYVYIDAMTFWGGSQFINSEGMGRYEDFLMNEVLPAVRANFPVSKDRWCVMGGSSGGYGALHLVSKFPETFSVAIALAPDSFFDASLIPEIRAMLPVLKRIGGAKGVREELLNGKLMKRKDWHMILNVVAMGLCYAPLKNGEPVWPVDIETGKIIDDVWAEWLKHDPLMFLPERKLTSAYYLDAGDRDQFHLQYGTRQVRDLLRQRKADVTWVGFEGTHFDLGERRGPAWQWLAGMWRS
jgi:enterochelin esterase family protein